jgi:hypothetical protein
MKTGTGYIDITKKIEQVIYYKRKEVRKNEQR